MDDNVPEIREFKGRDVFNEDPPEVSIEFTQVIIWQSRVHRRRNKKKERGRW